MADNIIKNPFVSPAWVDVATSVLEELVAEHGEEGVRYSVCEAFLGAVILALTAPNRS